MTETSSSQTCVLVGLLSHLYKLTVDSSRVGPESLYSYLFSCTRSPQSRL